MVGRLCFEFWGEKRGDWNRAKGGAALKFRSQEGQEHFNDYVTLNSSLYSAKRSAVLLFQVTLNMKDAN